MQREHPTSGILRELRMSHAAYLDAEIVMWTIDVRGDDTGEVAAVLVVVALVHDIDHALGIGISAVGVVGRSAVHHGLVDRVGGLVRENAGR